MNGPLNHRERVLRALERFDRHQQRERDRGRLKPAQRASDEAPSQQADSKQPPLPAAVEQPTTKEETTE